MDVDLKKLLIKNSDLVYEFLYDNMKVFMDEYPQCISFINFNDIFYENMKELFYIFVQYYFNINDLDYNLVEKIFYKFWKKTTCVFYRNEIPKRSYNVSFIRTLPNHNIIKQKIEYLRNIPQPVQRTDEWYNFRHNLITASNAYKCFENESLRNSIIYEKCKPIKEQSDNVFASLNTPFHHGQKYEPISVSIYEKRYNTIIEDFGCIPHKKHKFLGASPDGINVDENSNRYGRMLEIKNIFNRDIVDDPKKEYWIQMQLQMEVCNLNECDFLETRIKEYENFEEYKEDGSFTHTLFENEKGIIILFVNDNKPIYEYAPLGISEKNYEIWEKKTMDAHVNDTFISFTYWYLDEFSCKLVLRNKKWFLNNINYIQDTWNIIENERITGYSHRAPQKRIKKTKEIETGCLININNLNNNICEDIINLEVNTEAVNTETVNTEAVNTETVNNGSNNIYIKIHTESFDETVVNV